MCNLTYGPGRGARPAAGPVLALHADTAGGLSCGNKGRPGEAEGAPTVFFLRWSVILHSCSFLAARGGGDHAAQSSAGQQGEKEKQQAAQGGRARWGGRAQGWLLG